MFSYVDWSLGFSFCEFPEHVIYFFILFYSNEDGSGGNFFFPVHQQPTNVL